ncbi:MAG: hypothetical protein ACXWV5_06275 [Flavitalea sp.]
MKGQVPTIELFIQNFENQFQNPFEESVHPATSFRDLKEWTSLQALIIISSFDWDYEVIISAEELRKANTIDDLYHLVVNKINS